MEYKKQLEEVDPNSIHQFAVSQAEKSAKAAVLENQQDIKVRIALELGSTKSSYPLLYHIYYVTRSDFPYLGLTLYSYHFVLPVKRRLDLCLAFLMWSFVA